MRRAIVLQVRTSPDKNTGENLVWVVLGRIPSKSKDGKIFYPKTTDIVISTVAGELRSPDKYLKFLSLNVGAIVNVEMTINEYNNKPVVFSIETIVDSVFSEADLYGENGK